jgi:hypothetical protein
LVERNTFPPLTLSSLTVTGADRTSIIACPYTSPVLSGELPIITSPAEDSIAKRIPGVRPDMVAVNQSKTYLPGSLMVMTPVAAL